MNKRWRLHSRKTTKTTKQNTFKYEYVYLLPLLR